MGINSKLALLAISEFVGNLTGATFKFKLIDKLTPPYERSWVFWTSFLDKFGALKLNRDQVMTLETWLKIHTNLCNFVTVSPKTI